ncbi:IgGFc-binding protein Fcgamma-binding protein antigen [Larimichthys crocea]|uniref:IgGFc-binding protein Fcgamma-binding protein antigen n=1 Tax=Larimichthys crocea TaxID=215358 RepID=A0A6G0HXT7_LARCR|nr:IgGFc-binding protein Fcgamma-binding protein antigen [Larimichthys crocea]
MSMYPVAGLFEQTMEQEAALSMTVQRRTCTISGDPHYYTFDGTVFHFQGTCTYVLSEQCGRGLQYYRVEGKNEHRGSTRVSWTRLVKVYVYNETIELVKGRRGEAKVNGNFAATPISLSNGKVQVYESGFSVIVSADFGLEVSYDTNHYVRISVPYTYQNAICGLCGNFNNIPGDDLRTRQEIPCPSNSHFESQGTGCPATCVNPNSTQNCPRPNQESCICNSGYVLSAGVCVPRSECGCSFEGRYYRSGETVLLDNNCGRRCSCSHGSMTCRSHGCGALESCRVVDGERGCRPNSYATCWIRGPGSYHTFDGVTYQYPGACRLTLAKVMGLSSHPHFMVTAEKVPRGQQGFARVLKFEAEGTQVSIEMTGGSRVLVDGQQIRLPFSLASNRIQIYHSSIHSVILRTAFGVTVQTVWPHYVRVTAPGIYTGSLGGLCGNYNGHPHDDFRTPNGILVNSSQVFGDSWRDGSLAAHCVDNVNRNSPRNYNSSEYCGTLTSPHGPFAQCWATVDPQQYFDSCVDITSRDPASAQCEVLRDYALMCQQRGVALGHWRNVTGCDQNCPPNSHYELCGSACPSACPSLSFPFACAAVCQEGCQCDDGFVLNGNQCVPPTACGCYHQGRSRRGGEQFWDGEECQSLCTCNGTTGRVHCSRNSCGPQESCRVVEGEFGCHPNPHGTCSASGDPHYLTFDGKAYDFQGTCRYVLVTLCNATDDLHQFLVEAKNEPWSGLPVSITAEVFVNVWGYRVRNRGQDLLCRAIQAYVSACQSANVRIYPWRQNTTCRLDCPANSHYELCGTDCGHTCASSVDATCEQVCSEGCFCDEGFAKSGATCVPVESCGCQYDGFYYNAGESFWTDGCSQRCECHAPNDLRCSAESCTPVQECIIRDGQLGCFDAMTTCTVWGDPHYVTFDGALAHFQGTCSYIITESVSHRDNEIQFQVAATNNHRGNNRVSFVSAVDIYLSNQPESAYIRIGPNKRVQVNGSEVSLPTAAGTLAQVVRQGSYIVVDAVDFTVQFDGRSTLLVRMPQNRRNRVKGMCGNFNNNPADDKVLPNGTTAQNDNDFGHSWKASTSQPGCGSTDERNGDRLNDCRFVEEYSELCSIITNTSGPFSDCHLHSDPRPFFSSCVYDLCLYTPANGMLCSAISAYERTCSVLGLNITEWRSDLRCPESDPCEQLNCTEYEWCGQKDGVYGCFCDEHHHRRNNESYDSSITCVSSSGTMSVSRCQLFEAGFHSSALHLREESCTGNLQDGRLIFNFDNDDQLCGTVLRSNGTHFIYENTIQGDVDPHEGLISRQRNIHLRFCCEYPLTQALSMAVGINPVESIVSKKLPSGRGQFHTRMIPYEDAGFRFPLTSNTNIAMEVDERLYVEVRTEGVDQRQISTILDSCWATPVNLAGYPVRWDLITEECPNQEDGTVDLVQNGISTVARFSFRMFTFTNFSSIYLHCQVHLCLLRHNNCSAHCYPGYHRRVERDVSYHASTDISIGPLVMKRDTTAHVLMVKSSASGLLTSVVTLIVNHNGHLTFNNPDGTHRPQRFPIHGTKDFIAPFWTDLDNRQTGQVYYNQYTSGSVLQQATQDINAYFPSLNFNANWVFVATWYEVAYYSNSGTRTTAQAVLISGGQYSFVLMNYGIIASTSLSVQAGYDTINSVYHYIIPGSFSTTATGSNSNFRLGSNVNVPGRWAFRTDHGSRGCTFSGTCTYVLSEECGQRLPYYRVEGKNEHRGSTHVSWTRLVKVYVYNETIELVKGHRAKAKVNGNFAATPISLSNGTVQVYESGFSVIVTTDFGLEVSYDTNHYVRISVPYTYQNATCGLCGDFNNIRDDDFRTRQVLDLLLLAINDFPHRSLWKAVCMICVSEQGTNPFCAKPSMQYASQCQQHGIQLPSWRRQGFCEIPCPSNSHFESQGTGCPATCANPNSTQNCPRPNQESCICNSGYILSAGVCVPHSECGCSFEGRYYRSGETVILDEDCGRRCSCSHGSMTCRSHGCGALESCRVVDGERGCRPNSYATCWTRGPGSYHTFDEVTYQYPGACRLTLAKVMGLSNTPHFVVTAEKVPRGQQGFARLLRFEAEGTHISIEMSSGSRVQVDGQRIRLPFSSASNRIQIYHSSIHSVILRTAFGVTVQTVWPHYVRVTAPGIYNGSLGGLCGNYNGHPHDDFQTPNGILVNSSQVFGDSWRDGSLAAHCVDNVNQNSTTNYNSSEYCGILGSPHGPFAQCWATLDPQQHVDSCVDIIGASSDPASALCEVLRDYALMCQQRGGILGNWRNATGCEQNCPLNSHHELCGSSCPSACPSLSFPFTCDTACQDGCQCNDGFVLNGNQCVPPTACGCYHQGRYLQGGEQFWDGNDGQDLLCRAIEAYVSACQSANVRIYPWRQNTTCRLDCPANSHYELCGTDCGHTCASSVDATCEQVCSEGCFCDEGFLRSGSRCVPTERCGCEYDGFYYNAGESFWTDGCSQRCECHAPNDLRCSAVSCTPAQECIIRDGQLGCFDAMTTCTVWGDPHYITFDGALAHFQGTCSYIITESVSHHSNETQFLVVATNNHRGNNHVSFVSAVDIYLSNQPESAYIRIGPNKRVQVNGSEVSLPSAAGTLAQVARQGSHIVVDAIDLFVQFDGQSTLLVRIGQNRENRVKGMCGNFNNNPADDKVLPNGTTAQNDNDFGHSWKASTSQPGCGSADDDSDGGLNDCRFVEEYSELCSVITNTSGPFSDCHLHSDPRPFFSSCVYDLCLYTPANGMLCSAISAYEKTCSVLGLNIPEWRPALQCAESDPCEQLDCTEYEWCGEKDGVYGCFCDEHHHRPNNESYDSSITCVSSSATISVSRCQLFEAGFHLSALHLRDDSCNGTLQDGRLFFHFNNDDRLCGTILRSNGTHFIYENTIQGDVDPHEGLISREKSIHLHFSCEYPLAQALSMDVGINPVESIVNKRLPSGQGRYHLRMMPYEDAGFHFPLTRNRNVEMEIDQRLYIEVQTEGVDERQISTILDSCWATPFNDASYPVRWDLITTECPNPADGTVEVVQNGISTVARFSFRMFTFTNFSSIYLHCQVHLCLLRHSNCSAHCYPGIHTRVARDISFHDTAAISIGPLIPKSDKRVNPSSASGQLTSVVTLIVSLLTAKTLI